VGKFSKKKQSEGSAFLLIWHLKYSAMLSKILIPTAFLANLPTELLDFFSDETANISTAAFSGYRKIKSKYISSCTHKKRNEHGKKKIAKKYTFRPILDRFLYISRSFACGFSYLVGIVGNTYQMNGQSATLTPI